MPDLETVSIDQLNPYPGDRIQATDLLFVRNTEAGALQYATGSQVLGTDAPEPDVITVLASPFPVFNYSDNYEFTGGNTVITDTRLLGKTGYIVRNTKYQTDFKPSQLVYDSVAGSLTIPGFELDDPDDYVSIYVDGSTNSAVALAYKTLSDRIAINEAILIAFTPTALGGRGLMLAWYRPISEIPAGWSPVAEIPGRIPINIDTDPASPFKTMGAKLGAMAHKIDSTDKLPKHRHFTTVDDTKSAAGNPGDPGIPALTALRARLKAFFKTDGGGRESYTDAGAATDDAEPTVGPTSYTGKTTPDDIDHTPTVVVVCYIEYTGI